MRHRHGAGSMHPRRAALGLGLALALAPLPRTAGAIPYFARRYGVECSRCHVAPPKLNAFGEAFVARGYTMPALTSRRTWPLAIWLSGRSERLPVPDSLADELRGYLNRVEVISGGKLVAPWLSYFVEWRPVSREARGNGTIRDRAGRFEDLFLTTAGRRLELTVGQFRQIAQVDVSRRLGISEPLSLSASLPGAGVLSARKRSLRGFAPAGRSPALRAAWNGDGFGGWRWTAAAGLPISGEISIPLAREARTEASNEIEWRLKGVVLESFVRRGLTSFGAHAFYDDSDRYLANLVTTGARPPLYWTAVVGADRSGGVVRGRWSVEGEYLPHYFFGVGGRVEDRAADGGDVAFVPYVNAHLPGTSYTIRLTIERRLQRGRNATLVELGTVF